MRRFTDGAQFLRLFVGVVDLVDPANRFEPVAELRHERAIGVRSHDEVVGRLVELPVAAQSIELLLDLLTLAVAQGRVGSECRGRHGEIDARERARHLFERSFVLGPLGFRARPGEHDGDVEIGLEAVLDRVDRLGRLLLARRAELVFEGRHLAGDLEFLLHDRRLVRGPVLDVTTLQHPLRDVLQRLALELGLLRALFLAPIELQQPARQEDPVT